jgi:hypothetical protein
MGIPRSPSSWSETRVTLISSTSLKYLSRAVSFEEGQTYAKENNLEFMEVSAKTGANVEEVFLRTAQQIYDKVLNKEIDITNEQFGVKVGTDSNKRSNHLKKSMGP